MLIKKSSVLLAALCVALPRFAHMVLRGSRVGATELAAIIGSVLSERDILRGVNSDGGSASLLLRLACLAHAAGEDLCAAVALCCVLSAAVCSQLLSLCALRCCLCVLSAAVSVCFQLLSLCALSCCLCVLLAAVWISAVALCCVPVCICPILNLPCMRCYALYRTYMYSLPTGK